MRGILIQLVAEGLRWWALAFRSGQSIKAENLFLRRQLALYMERGVGPRISNAASSVVGLIQSRESA